ncbi:phosphonate C-P lyase system protein PhnH [Bradyrhizobium sp. USDA 4369]
MPTAAESRTAAAFDATMWAFAHPGETRCLPAPGVLVVAEALVDRGCTVHADDADMSRRLLALGARPLPVETAGFVFADLGAVDSDRLIARISIGDLAYPDTGATLFAPARIGKQGARLRLTGPGIDGMREVTFGGVNPAVWAARRERIAYPLGFDIVLVDDDVVLALPRSTKVNVI